MNPPSPLYIDREIVLLTKEGEWLSDGAEISHEGTRRMFSRNLKKDKEGWYIQVKHETKRIQVEDTAYFVTRIRGNPALGFTLDLSDETNEPLLPETLHYQPNRLTCRVKKSQFEAKFLHAAYFDLLQFLQEDKTGFFLEIGQKKTKVLL